MKCTLKKIKQEVDLECDCFLKKQTLNAHVFIHESVGLAKSVHVAACGPLGVKGETRCRKSSVLSSC